MKRKVTRTDLLGALAQQETELSRRIAIKQQESTSILMSNANHCRVGQAPGSFAIMDELESRASIERMRVLFRQINEHGLALKRERDSAKRIVILSAIEKLYDTVLESAREDQKRIGAPAAA